MTNSNFYPEFFFKNNISLTRDYQTFCSNFEKL